MHLCYTCFDSYILGNRLFQDVVCLQKVSNKTFPKLKEVDDVLGGSAAWENVDFTEATCPKCDHDKAFFMQVKQPFYYVHK